MKKVLSLLLTSFLLMSCSAAHKADVKTKIIKEYGTPGEHKKKVVVKTKSEINKEKAVKAAKPIVTKAPKPLLDKEEKETLIATSKISVTKNTIESYVDMYAPAAMQSMKTYGIPASIKLAQGILESGSGNGTLCRTANNHFGIKCKEEWTGDSVAHTDDAPDECFRKYASALESYNDHSEFLANRVYYKNLFTLDKSDYQAWAKGLKKAGYATDPKYPSKLINIIERYRLYEYDKMVLGNDYKFESANNEVEKRTSFNHSDIQTYTVQAGDTLYAISQKFNSTIDQIKELNNLKSNSLNVGQTIKLQ